MKVTRLSSVAACGGVFFVVAFVLVAALPHAAFAQGDLAARVGTWKVNLVKSTFDGPPPMSDTRTFQAYGDGVKATNEIVTADGTRMTVKYAARYDGKDYPSTGNPFYDTIAVEFLDAHTLQNTLKKAGKVVQRSTVVISNDGKVMTHTTTWNASGGHAVLIYDKQ